jgi:FAD/FMN-containing dehydrogenase
METIKKFQSQNPSLSIIYPGDKQWTETRQIFNTMVTVDPLAIVIAKNVEDVSKVVEFGTAEGIPISIRAGGNDCHGRTMAADALVLDIRALDSITIDKDLGVAKLGGGILQGKVAEELAQEGLVTPTGTIPWVGYVGWATLGGYGPWAGAYGLGIDQIVAAKIVEANGEVVEADGDILKGIKGAGGNFGVIVEVTIKVYPFGKVS